MQTIYINLDVDPSSIALFFGIIALLFVGYFVCSILWLCLTCDKRKLNEVRTMIRTAKLANAGNQNARITCELEPRITKGLIFTQEKGIQAHYSVSKHIRLSPFR